MQAKDVVTSPDETPRKEEVEESVHSENGSEDRLNSMADELDILADIVRAMLPIIDKLQQKDGTLEEKTRKPIVTPEIQRDRLDTRKRNICLAFRSPKSMNNDTLKRRDKNAMQLSFCRNLLSFRHELKSLRFSDISQFIKEL